MSRWITLMALLLMSCFLLTPPASAAYYPIVTGTWTGSLSTDGDWIPNNGGPIIQGYPNTQPVTLKVLYQSDYIYHDGHWAFITGTLTTPYFEDWGGTINFWGYVHRGGRVDIEFALGPQFGGSFGGYMTTSSAFSRSLNGTWSYQDPLNSQVGTMGLRQSLIRAPLPGTTLSPER